MDEYEPSSNLPAVVRAMLGTTHDRHLDLAGLVGGLPDEALAWTPCADAPALAGLVLHILDVEGHLVAIAAGRTITGQERTAATSSTAQRQRSCVMRSPSSA